MSRMICQCDECGKEFKIKRIKKQIFKDGDSKVFFQYFECPKCKAKYISHIENEEIKSIVREIKALQLKKSTVPKKYKDDPVAADAAIKEIINQIEGKKNKARIIQTELKSKFSLEK